MVNGKTQHRVYARAMFRQTSSSSRRNLHSIFFCFASETQNHVPFWACGVTPQAIAMAAKILLMVTPKPGHLFVSDLTMEQVANG
jgi:hypothetical protein